MIVDEIDNDTDVWPYAERYLGLGTRTYSRFAADLDVDDAYHPQRGPATFDLPTFWIPDEAGAYLTNGIHSGLHALYRTDGRFLLPVHPLTLGTLTDEVLASLRRHEPGPALTVIPSANVRTVFAILLGGRRVPPHFVKLHYPRRLSRFTRRLRRPIIGLQLWVADELNRIGAPFLPEVGGGVFGHDPKQAWGFLLRERQVNARTQPQHVVPMFALYGTDVRSPGDSTLLEQLVVRSGESPTRFLVDRVVAPMVRLWLLAVTQAGCVLEMHGQNTLFGFSDRLGPSLVAYRDCGVYVDPAIRTERGLPDDLPPINVIGRDVGWPRDQVFSLAYDSFLGHHTLAYLAAAARKVFGVPEQVLQEAARAEFRSGAADAPRMPETVSYYDGELHADGGWRLVDTGHAPDWR
jgi:hypothetical protein